MEEEGGVETVLPGGDDLGVGGLAGDRGDGVGVPGQGVDVHLRGGGGEVRWR